jgi:hypothetical protein
MNDAVESREPEFDCPDELCPISCFEVPDQKRCDKFRGADRINQA